MRRATSVRSVTRHGLLVGQTHDGRPVRSLTTGVFTRLRAEIVLPADRRKAPIAGLARRFTVSSARCVKRCRGRAEGLVTPDQRGFHVSRCRPTSWAISRRTRIDIEAWPAPIGRARRLGLGAEVGRPASVGGRAASACWGAGPQFEHWRALAPGSIWRWCRPRVSWLLVRTLYDQSERYRFLAYDRETSRPSMR
jgi:hypothetical protein